MHQVFENRAEAGRQLAERLSAYEGQPGVLVLGLPRGGVPVAFEVAMALGLPLDVFTARKVGVPGHEELAMGAVATGGVRVLNEKIVSAFAVRAPELERRIRDADDAVRSGDLRFRGDRPPVDVHGSTVILVDDGIATGATVRAAVTALRAQGARRVVVASPVAAMDSAVDVAHIADETVIVRTPQQFIAVGAWYRDFDQLEDAEVRVLLEQAAARLPEEGRHAAHRHSHLG
ncbi:MAG: phosphoribosyltransferase [Gemmatimonadaceae bacterium]